MSESKKIAEGAVNMKKGKIYEGVIEAVEFPNKGRIFLGNEQKTVIVKNGIPGQRVRFSVNKIRKEKAEGKILEVVKLSPVETETACPHFGKCGGCTYQTLPYKEQLKLKEMQIQEMMDKAIDGPYIWEGIKPSPMICGYRNKMEFSFGDEYKEGPLALGMHKRGSFYDIVSVRECRIVDEDYRRILTCTLEAAKDSGLPYYHRLRHTGFFRHLLVRKATKTKEILIDLVTIGETGNRNGAGIRVGGEIKNAPGTLTANKIENGPGTLTANKTQTESGLEETAREIEENRKFLRDWIERLLALPLDGTIIGVLHTKNDSVADVVRDDGTEVLYGQDYFYEELLGLRFKITPFSFFQTNSLGAEVLYEIVRGYIGDTKDKIIFDLYSGTGTIAQILAPVAKKVIGVEIVEEAVEAAKENAKLNGLTNCTFWAGDVLKIIDELREMPDLIVLDPPRDGVHPKALEKITNFGVERIVYIACKPTSLVRDLEILQGRGYRVERMACVDLFPGTYHVETIVSIQKKNS